MGCLDRVLKPATRAPLPNMNQLKSSRRFCSQPLSSHFARPPKLVEIGFDGKERIELYTSMPRTEWTYGWCRCLACGDRTMCVWPDHLEFT